MWRTIDANGKLKIVGSTGPTGPTGPTGASAALMPLTAPDNTTFSWVNQGSASVNATTGMIFLSAPATGVTSIRGRVLSLPTGSYTLTAALIPSLLTVNFSQCGLILRDSVTGSLITFSYEISTTPNISIFKYTSPTAFSTAYSVTKNINPLGPYLWFRIADNGTNRVSSISSDGINFRQIQSVGRTDFVTPNQVGFFADSNGSNEIANVTLVSWTF